MAFRDLEQFLRSLSTHSHLRDAYAKDPEKVMAEAGLSEDEKKLLRSKDTEAVKRYLGDSYIAATKVNIWKG